MGHGNRENVQSPLKVTYLSSIQLQVKSVACGEWHMVILLVNKSVWSCGSNSNGQLGVSIKDSYVSAPIEVSGLDKNIIQIGCGDSFSGALTSGGQLYTWGNSLYLGYKTNANSTPNVIPNVRNITFFCAGKKHSACITQKRELFTWGHNKFGQTGLNTNQETIFEPQQVTFPHPNASVISVSCGSNHTACIVETSNVMGMNKYRQLYSFGKAKKGQLGHGNLEEKLKSPRVTFNVEDVKQVACGKNHTLLLTSNNKLYSCGSNEKGELGVASPSSTPYSQTFFEIDSRYFDNEKIEQITASGSYNIVITEKSVYAWGVHSFQMNLGIRQMNEVPENTVQVCCGVGFTLALTEDGKVYYWGSKGNLSGTNTKSNKEVCCPIQIIALQTYKIIQIAVGPGLFFFFKEHVVKEKINEKKFRNLFSIDRKRNSFLVGKIWSSRKIDSFIN